MYGRAEAIRIRQAAYWGLQIRTRCGRSPLSPGFGLEHQNTLFCSNAVGVELVESDDLHDHRRRPPQGHRFTIQLLLRVYSRTSIPAFATVLSGLDERPIEGSCHRGSADDRCG